MLDILRRSWSSSPFVLLTACCQWPPSGARDANVRAAANQVDWTKFAALAKRHRVEGLAREALRRAGVRPTPAVAEALAVRAGEIARRGLMLAAQAARLQQIFDVAGIPNLLLKGSALEILAYGRLGLKSAWDIDLVVPPASAMRARAVLEAAGFDLRVPACPTAEEFQRWTTLSKECVFIGRDNDIIVELHWALVDGDLTPDLSVASPSQIVQAAPGVALRTLARDELIAYLVVHGASHGWSRLKWLADLNALLPQGDTVALEEVYRRSVALGAGVCPALALRLCRRLMGLEVSPALRRELDADPKARFLETVALNAMAGGGRELADRPFAEDGILVSRLLFDHGWRYRGREFRRQWVSIHDQTHIRLPGGLGFLYSVIRAPMWLWRRLRRP